MLNFLKCIGNSNVPPAQKLAGHTHAGQRFGWFQMDTTDLDHIDRKRTRRFRDEMRVYENHGRFVPNAGHVVVLGLAVHHPSVGQPRHDLDVRE